MSDGGGLIPISDAQAELGKEAIGALRATGSYLADVLGDLPKDLVGWLVGDRAKIRRGERLAKLKFDSDKRLMEQGILEPEDPPLKIAIPILEAAADEDRDELQDIWVRLLTAARNPARSRLVRQRFVTAARMLDPHDVLVLRHFGQTHGSFNRSETAHVARNLEMSADEFEVSFSNLAQAGFVGDYNGMTSGILAFGKEFLRAVAD